ncbi:MULTISPECIES: hypothetical protein [unclassified Pseudomonas]|uniref:hypothetical protein n=1 Tax=unclassified Pseudomonas TaxID=196821 RepID=UPI000C2FA46F|nr:MULTISPECIES: hypothetical protein [unclassified Pseudomonas]MCU1737542.1 hypothetical protein [Pseudomonas sp. 20S_6.2_Bac1]
MQENQVDRSAESFPDWGNGDGEFKHVRFIRPDTDTRIFSEEKDRLELSDKDPGRQHSEFYLDWTEAASMAARLHVDFGNEPRSAEYSRNVAAIAIEALTVMAGSYSWEFYGNNKDWHETELIKDIDRLMTIDEHYKSYVQNYATGDLIDKLKKLEVDTTSVLPDNLEDLPPSESVNSLSDTYQQKFEAWQGVMGSLDFEKPRMALLTVDQRRAEYEASQSGPERFKKVRAEHDLVNGYGAIKPAPPEKGSLSHWENELTEAANKTRRPLSGSEFKQIVSSIESCSRGADMEKAKAREVTGLLAKVHGPSGESLFRDPELREAYKAAITPYRNKLQSGSEINQEAAEQVSVRNNRATGPTRAR